MKDKALAEVITLYESNFRMIPETLRLIADQIEAGTKFGQVSDVAVVIFGRTLEICSLGTADAPACHLLLRAACLRFEKQIEEAGRG